MKYTPIKTCTSTLDRRKIIMSAMGASAVMAWHKPAINYILLPAHAQTSAPISNNITVSSLDAQNPFARYVLIVDENDTVLANCGASGGTATLENLANGEYRIFGDSNGMQNHQISITTNTQSATLTVPTDLGDCNFLMASVSIPSGVITQETGDQVASTWNCFSNQNQSCS